MTYLNIAAGAVFFAVTAFGACLIGRRLCRSVEPFADGPKPAAPPLPWMYLCAVLVGGLLGLHGMQIPTLAFTSLVNGCLIGSWYCDARCGIIPDWFTLPAIAGLFVFCLWIHDYFPIVIAAAIFLPFAVQAYRSKGLGMGWGDAKLVAFGGLLLGQNAFLATMFACLGMVVYAKAMKRAQEPIALGPFIVVGFEGALGLFTIVHT